MTPEEGSAESSSAQSGATTVRRPSGRGRYSRGRRRPRRSTNQPRRLPLASEAPPPESDAVGDAGEGERQPGQASPRDEGRREPLSPPFQPAKVESIQAAIDKVTAVIGDLRDVLNDMELVLEYLEDAERQQIADEREIETLQQRLNSIHRRADRHQPPQRPPQRSSDENRDVAD